MKQDLEESKRGNLPDQLCAILMIIGGFVFPLTRKLGEDTNSFLADFIWGLPLQSYLSNVALFGGPIFLERALSV